MESNNIIPLVTKIADPFYASELKWMISDELNQILFVNISVL
jgi:hypothetical protein